MQYRPAVDLIFETDYDDSLNCLCTFINPFNLINYCKLFCGMPEPSKV